MHRRSRYSRRSSHLGDYVLPFLIIIAIGVILVLLFNFARNFFGDDVKRGAYMHLVEGNADIKVWGTDSFVDLAADVLLLPGDEIKISDDSLVIVEFFDGTIMRLKGGSNVILQDMSGEGADVEIDVLLVDGQVWFNKVFKEGATNTKLTIRMDNASVFSAADNRFVVGNEFEESVRVLGGSEDVRVDILSKEDDKIVESENVGVGQELVLTAEALERYWKFQSPSILQPFSDEFKQTEWYTWNIEEDMNPTLFEKLVDENGLEYVKVEPEVLEQETATENADGEVVDGEEVSDGNEDVARENDEVTADENTDATKDSELTADQMGDIFVIDKLTKPTITSVAGVTETNADGYYVVTSRVATLTGSVSGADKVVVNGYTLTKFNAGDKTWSYFANADYELMKPGENTYEVYAIDSVGTRSPSITVKVYYDPPGGVAPAAETTTETDASANTDTDQQDEGNTEEVLTEESSAA